MTLGEVFGSVQTAVDRVAVGTAALGAAAREIENYDSLLADFSNVLDEGLRRLVDVDLEKESANLLAQRMQLQLGTETVGMTGKARSDALQSLFRDSVGATLSSGGGGPLDRSAVLRVDGSENGPDGGLRRSAILSVGGDTAGLASGGGALHRSAVLRISGGTASGARLDIAV